MIHMSEDDPEPSDWWLVAIILVVAGAGLWLLL